MLAQACKIGIVSPKKKPSELTILGLAKQLAGEVQRNPVPLDIDKLDDWMKTSKGELRELIRYADPKLKHPWGVANFKNSESRVETETYRLEFTNGLSASAAWLQPIEAKKEGPTVAQKEDGLATIVLNDCGRSSASKECCPPGGSARVIDLLSSDSKVLAVDLLFFGDASPDFLPPHDGVRTNDQVLVESGLNTDFLRSRPPSLLYTQLLETMGRQRAIGLQASQLVGTAEWLKEKAHLNRINVSTCGARSQVIGNCSPCCL